MSFYFKKDPTKYTQRDFDTMIYELDSYRYYSDCWTKAEMLSNLFTRCKNVTYDDSFDGMAAIDIDSKRIIINREKIMTVLLQASPFVIVNIDHFPYLVEKDWEGKEYFSVQQYISMFACYLILHEVGHYLYTVPASFVKQKAKEVCAGMHIPFSFVFFVNNVVEDSFIQRRLQLDYPVQLYRDIFFLGTTIVQGPFSIVNFVKELGEGKPLSIKTKLFYLILRVYNLFDKDVQSMFNNNPLLEWTPEVLDLFDKAITILDKEERCDFTTNQLVPALFNILHEVVKIKKDELRNCVPDSQSLLDDDKLREAELDDEDDDDSQDDSQPKDADEDDNFSSTNDTSKGNPDSDKPEDEDGEEKDCAGDTDSEDDTEDDGDSDEEGEAGSSDSEDEEEDLDEEDTSGSSSEDEDENEGDEADDADAEEGDASSDELDSDSSSDSKSEAKTPDGKSLEDAAQELEDNFNKELEEAAKELNSSIDEGVERDFDKETVDSLENFAEDVDVNDITNAINEVKKTTQKTNRNMSNLDSYEKNRSTFSSGAQALFNTASQLFKRIYTFDTEDLSYLDNGELDENLITDFYTEKSINIFKQHLDLVETKKIKVVFMVDDSGSMGGMRADNCRTIVPPLIHAFEESGIKCAFFMFGSQCAIVKDFDDPAVLVDNATSNILYQMDRTNVGGSTNITPALLALASRDYTDKDDTIYILFVLTDGGFDNEMTACQIFSYLRKEIGFKLFGITIDDPYGVERLKRDMYENSPECNDFIFDYSTNELITKLPQDIYNIIVDRFIKKN